MNSSQKKPPALETRWTLIRQVQGNDDGSRRAALEELCRIYRKVVVTALIGKHGFPLHEAEDVAQGFLAYMLVQRTFDSANSARGKFRSFLFTFLDRFVAHHRRKIKAQKRGGAVQSIPMEELQSPSGSFPVSDHQPSPSEELDRAWARATLKEAMRKLEEEFHHAGKHNEFVKFVSLLARDTPAGSYEGMAREMHISEENLRQRVSRFKKQIRAAMESMVRDTVGTEADLNEEFAYLWQCLN